MEGIGYRIVEATNGYDAIEYVKLELLDLILMDMSLPEIDGLSATRRIKELANTDKIPVICVTAHGDFYREKAIEAGCKEIVTKPVDLDNLSKVVNHYLSKRD